MPHTRLLDPSGAAEPAALPDLPEIVVSADYILIGASKLFPFRTLMLTADDGTPLAEILSFAPATLTPLGDRDNDGRPLLRVYVDDEVIHDVARSPSPSEVSSGGMTRTARQAETSTDTYNGDAP